MTIRIPDSTIAMLPKGCTVIHARRDSYGTDVLRSRLMLRPVVCLTGAEAADMFYRSGRFTRVTRDLG